MPLTIPGFGNNYGGMSVGGGRAALTLDMTVPTGAMTFVPTEKLGAFNVLSPGQMVIVDPDYDPGGIFKKDLWTISLRPPSATETGTVRLYKLEGSHGKSVPGIWESFPLNPGHKSGLPALLGQFRVVRPHTAISGIFTKIIPPIILPGSAAIMQRTNPDFLFAAVQACVDTFMQDVPVDENEYQNRTMYDKAMAAGIFIFQSGQQIIDAAGACYDAGGLGLNSFRLVVSAGRKFIQFAGDLLTAGEQDAALNPKSTERMTRAAWELDAEIELILLNMARVTLYCMSNLAWAVTSDYTVARYQRMFMEGMLAWLDNPAADHEGYVFNYTPEKVETLRNACRTYLDTTEQESDFREKCADIIARTMNASPNRFDGYSYKTTSGGLAIPGPTPPPGDDTPVLRYLSGYLNSMIKSNLFLANTMTNNNPLGPTIKARATIDSEEADLALAGLGAPPGGTTPQKPARSAPQPRRTGRSSNADPNSTGSRSRKAIADWIKNWEAENVRMETMEIRQLGENSKKDITKALVDFAKNLKREINAIFESHMGYKIGGPRMPAEKLVFYTSQQIGKMKTELTMRRGQAGGNMKGTEVPGPQRTHAMNEFEKFIAYWKKKAETNKADAIIYEGILAKANLTRQTAPPHIGNRGAYLKSLGKDIKQLTQIEHTRSGYLIDAWILLEHKLKDMDVNTVEGLMGRLHLLVETSHMLTQSKTAGNLKAPLQKSWLEEANMQEALMTLTHKMKEELTDPQMEGFLAELLDRADFTKAELIQSAIKYKQNMEGTWRKLDTEMRELDALSSRDLDWAKKTNYRTVVDKKTGKPRQEPRRITDVNSDVKRDMTNKERWHELEHHTAAGVPAGKLNEAKRHLEEAIYYESYLIKVENSSSATAAKATVDNNRPVSAENLRDAKNRQQQQGGSPKDVLIEQLDTVPTTEAPNEGGIRRVVFNLINAVLKKYSDYRVEYSPKSGRYEGSFHGMRISDYFNPKSTRYSWLLISMKSGKKGERSGTKDVDGATTTYAETEGGPRILEHAKPEKNLGKPTYEPAKPEKNAEELQKELKQLHDEAVDIAVDMSHSTEGYGTVNPVIKGRQGERVFDRVDRNSELAYQEWGEHGHHRWMQEKAEKLAKVMERMDEITNTNGTGILDLEVARVEGKTTTGLNAPDATTIPGKLLQAVKDVIYTGLRRNKDNQTRNQKIAGAAARITIIAGGWWTGAPQIYYGIKFYHSYKSTNIGLTRTMGVLVIFPLVSSAVNFSAPGALVELIGIDKKWLGWFGRSISDIATEQEIKRDSQTWGFVAGYATLAGAVANILVSVLPRHKESKDKALRDKALSEACEKIRPDVEKLPVDGIKKVLVQAGVDKDTATQVNDAIVSCDVDEIQNLGFVIEKVKKQLHTAIESAEGEATRATLNSIFTIIKKVIPDARISDAPSGAGEEGNADSSPDFLNLAWKLAAIGIGIWFLTDTKAAVETVTGAFRRVTGGSSRKQPTGLPSPGAKAPVGKPTNVPDWQSKLKQARTDGTKAQERLAIDMLSKARQRGYSVTESLIPQL
jgi:hypothetical protein